MKTLNIGLVGYGFMGRTHSNAFQQAPHFFDLPYQPVLKTVCARNAGARRRPSPRNWGYESVETDWRKLVERKDIDLIDIASPNDTHHEIAIAAAQGRQDGDVREAAGAQRRRSARRWSKAVEAAGVAEHGLVQLPPRARGHAAKQLIDEGKLGRIFHYRAKFLQDWTISQTCRRAAKVCGGSTSNVAGSGVTGDLLAHCIDTALWLNGPINEVTAMTETFIKERKHNLTGKVEPVGIDDASAFLAGSRTARWRRSRRPATRAATRRSTRSRSTASTRRVIWDLHDLHRLQYFDHRDEGQLRGWRSIHITDGDHPYMKHWWVPGLQIGYEHTFIHQSADFLTAAAEGKRRPRRSATRCRPTTSRTRSWSPRRKGRWESGRRTASRFRVHRFRVQGSGPGSKFGSTFG